MPPSRSKNYSSRGEKVLRSPGLSVSLPGSLKADLTELAGGRGESVSRVVRELIERELTGTTVTVGLGSEVRGELTRKAGELGAEPEVLARCLIRGGLRGMEGRPDAY